MKYKSFAVFILTHGRPDNVVTLKTLLKAGYTGKYYLIIDNEDKKADQYYRNFGDHVIMFDKKEMSQRFDTGDYSEERRSIVYARNASFDIAKEIGVDYFLQLDDDYNSFGVRIPRKNALKQYAIKDFDGLCDSMLDFLEVTGAKTVCFSQGGDHVGGVNGRWRQGLIRKVMNSFFFKTDNPMTFVGRINEDVNTYTTLGSRGELLLTVTDVILTQLQTQSNEGGMTDIYKLSGTYLKSFFTVMYMPSAVTVKEMGVANKRLHHSVKWRSGDPSRKIEEGGRIICGKVSSVANGRWLESDRIMG